MKIQLKRKKEFKFCIKYVSINSPFFNVCVFTFSLCFLVSETEKLLSFSVLSVQAFCLCDPAKIMECRENSQTLESALVAPASLVNSLTNTAQLLLSEKSDKSEDSVDFIIALSRVPAELDSIVESVNKTPKQTFLLSNNKINKPNIYFQLVLNKKLTEIRI